MKVISKKKKKKRKKRRIFHFPELVEYVLLCLLFPVKRCLLSLFFIIVTIDVVF